MSGTMRLGSSCLLMSLLPMLLMLPVTVASASAQEPRQEPRREPPVEEPSSSLLDRAGITGSVRGGYWSSTRDLDSDAHLGAGMVWLKTARPAISFRI